MLRSGIERSVVWPKLIDSVWVASCFFPESVANGFISARQRRNCVAGEDDNDFAVRFSIREV